MDIMAIRGFSPSPLLKNLEIAKKAKELSDRMTGLLCKGIHLLPHAGLLRQASVEPDKRVSTHPALRAQYIMGCRPMPLSRISSSVYRVYWHVSTMSATFSFTR